MQLQDSLATFLQPHRLPELEHTPKSEYEIGYAQMVRLLNHQSLHGLLVVIF